MAAKKQKKKKKKKTQKTTKKTKKKAAPAKKAAKTAKKKAKKTPASKPQQELAGHDELLSFLDTRVDDERFVAFARRTGLKKNKLYSPPGHQEFSDKKNGITVSFENDWIFSVEVGPKYPGQRAHGIARDATRSAVQRALGRPVFSQDNVDKFDRDLWRWHVLYDHEGKLEDLSVCPIDIETGARKSGASPRG